MGLHMEEGPESNFRDGGHAMTILIEAGRFSLIPLLNFIQREVVSPDPPIFTGVKVAGSLEFGLDPPRTPLRIRPLIPQSQGDSWRGSEPQTLAPMSVHIFHRIHKIRCHDEREDEP